MRVTVSMDNGNLEKGTVIALHSTFAVVSLDEQSDMITHNVPYYKIVSYECINVVNRAYAELAYAAR